MKTSAFIFDIGGVVLNYDLEAIAARIARRAPPIMEQVRQLRWDSSLREVESGRISGREYFARHIGPLAPGWSYRDLVQAWGDVFTINEDGFRLLRELREKGQPVYLLSNLADFNAEAIEEKFPEVLAAVSGRFYSFELGCVKPEPDIYLAACGRIGVAPGECLFLDDTIECVEGARRVGMRASHFTAARVATIRREVSDAMRGANGAGAVAAGAGVRDGAGG